MKQLLGFIFFWIATGMIIMLFIPSKLYAIICIAILLILSYNLFFCNCP